MLWRTRLARSLVLAVSTAPWVLAQADQAARRQLIESLDRIANVELARRAEAVSRIRTRAESERRKEEVRRKILDLIGGLPAHGDPVAVKEFGSITGDGFRVEKIAYESLPGFWVTADVYLPAEGAGPFPAVVLAPGHGATGKVSLYAFGANFARSGVIALAIDPLGQGERLQYFDRERNASIIGPPTGEHGEANVPALLIGANVARFMIHDSMRGIDYLVSRKDVDSARIGAMGCSGGGTSTAYLAALDDRVKVAGVACFITSFEELLPSATGVQEAEQSIPHFIERGLDLADWVEVFAPKPYAVISTTEDMFPFAGARQSVTEAKRIYELYGAGDRLQWITGPGKHGNLGPVSPAILGFFLHYLKGSPPGDAPFTPMQPPAHDLICTPTGQVSTSLGEETVASLVRANAAKLLPARTAVATPSELAALRTRVRKDIRELTSAEAAPGARAPSVRTMQSEQRGNYRLATIAISSGSAELPGKIAIPDRAGKKGVLLILDPISEKTAAPGGDLDHLASSGRIVLAIEPRPAPPGSEGAKSPYLGTFNLLGLRASLVGKTIVGLRVDDAIRSLDWLAARPDVDPSAVSIYGQGALGVVALHVAALDERVRQVVVEDSLASYQMVLDQPLHRSIPEVLIPGVLRKYDLGDLLLAIAPRPVSVINPRDATGASLSVEQLRQEMKYVMQSQENLGTRGRIKVLLRGGSDPLTLD